jgi:hypothetical protein
VPAIVWVIFIGAELGVFTVFFLYNLYNFKRYMAQALNDLKPFLPESMDALNELKFRSGLPFLREPMDALKDRLALPFQPEPMNALKVRYPEAVAEVFDNTNLTATRINPNRPGLQRKNVFDFENGARLVISRHRVILKGETQERIYFSATMERGYPLYNKLIKKAKRSSLYTLTMTKAAKNVRRIIEEFFVVAEQLITELSGEEVSEDDFLGLTDSALHWSLKIRPQGCSRS